MNKIMKYGFPVAIGLNLLAACLNFFTNDILLGISRVLLSWFMFLYYSEIKSKL